VASSEQAGSRLDAIDPLRYLGLIACNRGDLAEASTRFAEALALLRERGSRAAMAVGLADAATFAASREMWHSAGRLFAKAEAVLNAEGAAFSLPARTHYEAEHNRTRLALGHAGHAVAAAAGQRLTLEQAVVAAETVLDLRLDVDPAATVELGAHSATEDNLFTEREQDVLRLLVMGKTNPEIAAVLNIGRGTVRTHVSHILAKLGARSRTEASMIARDRGLL
jgi:DNA-binding CsgD family transcriptional regulator